MRLESVTRYVPSRSAAQKSASDVARIAVSVPRVQILERNLDDDRPRWKGRPADALADDCATAIFRARHVPTRRWVEPVRPRAAPAVAEPPAAPVIEAVATSEAPAPRPCAPIGLARRSTAIRGNRIRAVVRACAEAGEIIPHCLMSDRRTLRYCLPRHVTLWLLVNVVGLSLPQAGREIGRRDHTTALNSCRIVDAAMARAGIEARDDVEIVDFARDVIAALRAGRAA